MISSSEREERDEAILNTFYNTMKEVQAELGFVSIEETFNRCEGKQAPRFYISVSRAVRYISRMRKGHKVCFGNANKQKMYQDILERFNEIYKPYQSYSMVMARVLEQAAPSFYISRDSFKHCVYNAIKKQRKCI